MEIKNGLSCNPPTTGQSTKYIKNSLPTFGGNSQAENTLKNHIFSDVITNDLSKSGLTVEDAKELGWYEVTDANTLEKITKKDFGACQWMLSNYYILAFPYPGCDFARVRLYPKTEVAEKTMKERKRKYLQPKDTPPKPYILPQIAELKEKPHKPIIITEGEKKTACLVKNRFDAIGLSGVWQFEKGKEFLLDDWVWKDRTVYVCFDADAVNNENVLKAEIELSIYLWLHQAQVYIIRIPQGTHKEKIGVDDYITKYGVETFKKDVYGKAVEFHKAYAVQQSKFIINRLVALKTIFGIQESIMASLIKLFAKGLGVATADLRKDYEYALLKSTNKKDEKREIPDDIKTKAYEILKAPDLIDKYLKFVGNFYVGREKEKTLLRLLLTARKLPSKKGIGIAIKGVSSVGKSELVSTVLKTCDDTDLVEYTRATTNFLLYRTEPLAHKILTIFELPGTDDMAMNLRVALSEGVLKLGTVDKKGGSLGIYENEVDARGMVFITTTTRTKLDEELATRLIEIEIEHDEQIARKVYEQMASDKKIDESEIEVWKAVDALIEMHPVVIPFAKGLINEFPTKNERHLRDFGKVLTLIKASALLHQFQRNKDNAGQIIATLKDYEIVFNLRRLIFQSMSDEKLKTAYEAIKENGGEITAKELIEKLNVSKPTLDRRIRELLEKEMIEVEGRGKTKKIKLIGSIESTFSFLPEKAHLIPYGLIDSNDKNQHRDGKKMSQRQNDPFDPMTQNENMQRVVPKIWRIRGESKQIRHLDNVAYF